MKFESAAVSTTDKLPVHFEVIYSPSSAFTPKPTAFMVDQRLVEQLFAGFLVTANLTLEPSVETCSTFRSNFWITCLLSNFILWNTGQ